MKYVIGDAMAGEVFVPSKCDVTSPRNGFRD